MLRRRTRKLNLETLEYRRLLATLTVESNEDVGPGTLRQAILDANQLPGADEIVFNLPVEGLEIRPDSPLPEIVDSLFLDATTQPGYQDVPIVTLTGIGLPQSDASGLVIAAPSVTVRGFVIGAFPHAGILVKEAVGARVEGNFIGTNGNGSLQGRQNVGVHLFHSTNSVVGGAAEAGNVISGNAEVGVKVWGERATNNRIQGNRIGTDASGSYAVPNQLGVLIAATASENFVGINAAGSLDAQLGNLISGNSLRGVEVNKASSNVIAGNFIGTNEDGLAAISSQDIGVFVVNDSDGNLIGGSSAVEANVISGHEDHGVFIRNSFQNRVSGNLIGTGADGTTEIGNKRNGVWLTYASDNTIGTDGDGIGDEAEGNVISSGGCGVFAGASHQNRFAGNLIGTDATGTRPLPNRIGLHLTWGSSHNVIGTDADGISDGWERNVVSGNERNGIELNNSSHNIVAGNWMGLGADGSVVANEHSGIWISNGATNNQIGGTRPAERNVISGNLYEGVSIAANANTVIGNYIGTTADGLGAAGNHRQNVQVYGGAVGNQIGGVAEPSRNVIAAAGIHGVKVRAANQTVIQGNWIGLGADGETLLGNKANGISLGSNNTTDTTIGGVSSGAGNVIAANGKSGIDSFWTFRTEVLGNSIGLTANGASASNGDAAIRFANSKDNFIGDGTKSGSNSILSVDHPAVAATGDAQHVFFLNNTVSTNTIPVDLAEDGPTINDSGDWDFGPNNLQNYRPVVTATTNPHFSIITAGPLDSIDEPREEHAYAVRPSDDGMMTYRYIGERENLSGASASNGWRGNFGSIADDELVSLITHDNNNGSSEFSPTVPLSQPLGVSLSTGNVYDEGAGSAIEGVVSRGNLELDKSVEVHLLLLDGRHAFVSATIPAGQTSSSFSMPIDDDDVPQWTQTIVVVAIAEAIEATSSFEVTIRRSDVWHNDIMPFDVSGDMQIAPNDVLSIVNRLNSEGSGSLPAMNETDEFFDVNQDQYLTPLDALLVINYLNSHRQAAGETGAEGESSRTADWAAHPELLAPSDFGLHRQNSFWLTDRLYFRYRHNSPYLIFHG